MRGREQGCDPVMAIAFGNIVRGVLIIAALAASLNESLAQEPEKPTPPAWNPAPYLPSRIDSIAAPIGLARGARLEGTRSARYSKKEGLALFATKPEIFGVHQYRAYRLDCALRGLDLAGEKGLSIGAAGTAAGLFDEEAAWYIAGASALLGAILGGTKGAESPSWRERYAWDDEERR